MLVAACLASLIAIAPTAKMEARTPRYRVPTNAGAGGTVVVWHESLAVIRVDDDTAPAATERDEHAWLPHTSARVRALFSTRAIETVDARF